MKTTLAEQRMDVQTLGIVALAVAVVAFVLYIWDRRTKQQTLDYGDATKIALGAGTIASGVAYAVGGENIADAIESVTESAQEMFVGKPAW